MAHYWYVHGPFLEGRTWLERALALTPADRMPALSARVRFAAGMVFSRQADLTGAEALFEESLTLYQGCGDHRGEAEALFFLAITREMQDRRGDPHGVTPLFMRVAELCQALDHPLRRYALFSIGWMAFQCGDATRALPALQDAASRFAQDGDQWGHAMAQTYLAVVVLDQGEATRAATRAATGLRLFHEEGDWVGMRNAVLYLVSAAAMLGQGEAAGRLLGAVDRHTERLGLLPDPDFLDRRERTMAALRTTMGTERTAAVVGAGQAIPFPQAVEEALALAEGLSYIDRPRTSRRPRSLGLSTREEEILHLIAAGWTNAEIALALSIAPRTVTTHASHILNKLGLTSRPELIAFAHREGLA
jgi:non-specific serine/threonine protein kinase